MNFKLHLRESKGLQRVCHQDRLIDNTTLKLEDVTCRKCLKSAFRKAIKRKDERMAKAYAEAYMTLNIKTALGPSMKLLTK